MKRSAMTFLMTAACMIATPAMAGDCYTAVIAGPIQLPDDSRFDAHSLRVCRDDLTPVTGLHVTYVDGMPIGMFRSRIEQVEGVGPADGVEPSMVFSRAGDGRLTLIAALLPGKKGLTLYDLRPTTGLRRASIARVMRRSEEVVRVAAIAGRRDHG